MASAVRLALAMAVTVAALAVAVQASDPELTTDFFVPADTNKSTITGDYFTSTFFRDPIQQGFNVTAPATTALLRLNSDNTPVLTGLGVSVAIIKYAPGGINPPHTHPRGSEVLIVVDGILTVGLVDTSNKLYTQVLYVGDVFVFPKGLVHFQFNNWTTDALAFVSFSSSNPGTVSLPATLFGSGIADDVLERAFKVDQVVVDSLQSPFGL